MEKILGILNKVKKNGADSLTHDDKVILFKGMARTDGVGAKLRRAYAAVQGELLLPVIRQESHIRRIFREQFTNGQQIQFPIRSKRIRAAWYGSDKSHTPQRQADSDSIYVNTFPIQGGCAWLLKQIATGNYNIVEELQNDMVDEVVYKEESAGWTLIKAALAYGDIHSIARLTTANSDITDDKQGSSFSIYVFNEMITAMDEKPDGGRMLTDLFVTPRRYGDLRKWVTTNLQDLSDGVRTEMFNTGQSIGERGVWDVAIWKVRDAEFVDNTKAWGFGRGFGVMAVSENWTTADDPTAILRWKQAIFGKEEVGFAVTDVESACVYNFV